jgi:hypothetical protein
MEIRLSMRGIFRMALMVGLREGSFYNIVDISEFSEGE